MLTNTLDYTLRTQYHHNTLIIHCTSEKIETLEFANKANVECIIVDEGIIEIGSWAFYDCKNLKTIILPSTLKKIHFAAFHGCESLESIKIPYGVVEIGGAAFHGCKKLSEIQLPETLEFIGIKAFEDTNLHSQSGNFRGIQVAFDGFVREATVRSEVVNFTHKKWAEKNDGRLNLHGYHIYHNLFELFNYYGGSLFNGKFAIYTCKTKNVIDTGKNVSVVETYKTTKQLEVKDIIALLNNN